MSFEWLTPALLILLLLVTLWIALRRGERDSLDTLRGDFHAAVRSDLQQLERELRDEVARSAVGTRQELTQGLATFQLGLLAQHGDVARTQNEQIDSFRAQLATALQRFSETLNEQLRGLSQSNDQRMTEVRVSVEQKLAAIQTDNEKKLEQIRATVDEKLHATLEQRLGESFKQVADRLEQVHRGLGEMQTLARDVGSLNRVLTNVKTRGVFGEVQLSALLEQVLTLDQYATNVETVPGSGARVEFAIKLPGRRDDGAPLWLPIDCKFPRDDYERLVEAQEAADRVGVETYSRAIEARLRREAL